MYRSSKNNASIFLQSNYKGEIHNSPHKQTLIDIAMKPPCVSWGPAQKERLNYLEWNKNFNLEKEKIARWEVFG